MQQMSALPTEPMGAPHPVFLLLLLSGGYRTKLCCPLHHYFLRRVKVSDKPSYGSTTPTSTQVAPVAVQPTLIS